MFRSEVLHHLTSRRLGTVLLVRPVSHSVLVLLYVVIVILLGSFFILASVTRKANVNGILLPENGLIRVVAQQGGIVHERKAREGQFVRVGDPLFVLTNDRRINSQESVERIVSSLLDARRESLRIDRNDLRKQYASRIEALQRRIGELQTERNRIEEQIVLQRHRVVLVDGSVERYKRLQSAGFVSSAQVEDRLADAIDQQQRLSDLQRALSTNARDTAATLGELHNAELQLKRDDEAAARNISAVTQDLTENEAKRETIIRATQSGIISAIVVDPGQVVTSNQTMATIVPEGSELEAQLFVSSRSIGLISREMPVQIRYQAFPYEKFGQYHGKVIEVSTSSLRQDEYSTSGVPSMSAQSGEPLYRVRVRLDHQTVGAYGNQLPLRAGMMLDATVVLEKRRLYEWILAPLYAVSGKI